MVCPLADWLKGRGVVFRTDFNVTDLTMTEIGGDVAVAEIRGEGPGGRDVIAVAERDLVILQNGSMTDASRYGSHDSAPARPSTAQSKSWRLWENIARARTDFGNPAAFNSSIPETSWLSFTASLRKPEFFDQMEAFSGNKAGTGGIVTLKDSRWLMSFVIHHQPHFSNQPEDAYVFWGYALHPDRVGDFVAKPMFDCSGAEILRELAGHLNFDPAIFDDANCIPCRMPYITSQFMPRKIADRPLPVPKSSRNLAFVSQFVEIPDDTVFTIEYSVRAAQMAVYEWLGVEREIPPVSRHDESWGVRMNAIIKAFR